MGSLHYVCLYIVLIEQLPANRDAVKEKRSFDLEVCPVL